MSHVESYLVRAVNPLNGDVLREKKVYDRYTAECFAAEWHMRASLRNANIFVGKTLMFGHLKG